MIREIEDTIRAIPGLDKDKLEEAAARQLTLTKPAGSLGRMEQFANRMAGVMSVSRPNPDPCALILAAASHGVVEEGVSAFPGEVTVQMVFNFLSGGAAINAISESIGADLFLVDAGVAGELPPHPDLSIHKIAEGTGNFARVEAMTKDQAEQIVSRGIGFANDLLDRGYRVLALGDMGIGNTTAAAAVTAAATGAPVDEVTGRGTMVDDERYRDKVATVQQALALHPTDSADGIGMLSAVGGFEIGFLSGCILGAAARRAPVILDGYPTTASALIAVAMAPLAGDALFAGHVSAEPGHRIALEHLGLTPVLDLDMRLGEGTGAVLALGVLRAACNCLNRMATFEQAAVAGRIE